MGLLKISESDRAYAYLILSSQASARSGIVGNTASALTAQSVFLNNFENVVNHRVDIREDIKRYQDTLSYASSKVDHSMGQNIYMLPSDMNLKISSGTIGYNNKILVSDEKFSLGKNDEVNLTVPAIKSHKVTKTAANSNDALPSYGSQASNISHKNLGPHTITHNDEKIALVLLLAGGFAIFLICFNEQNICVPWYTRSHATYVIVIVIVIVIVYVHHDFGNRGTQNLMQLLI